MMDIFYGDGDHHVIMGHTVDPLSGVLFYFYHKLKSIKTSNILCVYVRKDCHKILINWKIFQVELSNNLTSQP